MKQVPTLAKSSAHCMAIFKYVLHQPSVVNQWSYLNILSAAWQRTLRTANITTWVLGSTWPAWGTRVSRRVRRQWQLGALHTVTTQLGTVTGTEMRPDEDLRNIRQVSHQQNFTVSRYNNTLPSKHYTKLQLLKPDTRNLWRQPRKKMKTQMLRRPTVWFYLTYPRISLLWC